MELKRIAMGGGCHWCTEAVFKSLLGVAKVEQGWIAAEGTGDASFSEGVIVYFDESVINLATVIEIHLYTHSCTSNHALRKRYRSAIYTFEEAQAKEANTILEGLQPDFAMPIITKVLPYGAFQGNMERLLDYYYKNPERGFCQTHIDPKLRFLMKRFSKQVDVEKVAHLRDRDA